MDLWTFCQTTIRTMTLAWSQRNCSPLQIKMILFGFIKTFSPAFINLWLFRQSEGLGAWGKNPINSMFVETNPKTSEPVLFYNCSKRWRGAWGGILQLLTANIWVGETRYCRGTDSIVFSVGRICSQFFGICLRWSISFWLLHLSKKAFCSYYGIQKSVQTPQIFFENI